MPQFRIDGYATETATGAVYRVVGVNPGARRLTIEDEHGRRSAAAYRFTPMPDGYRPPQPKHEGTEDHE